MSYISKYSNGKEVTAAQYITELICENKAKKDNKDLHYRFWTNREWASYYRNQIATANKLVQQYNEQAIIRALKNKKAAKIYSLRAPHLIAIIEEESKNLENINTTLSQEYNRESVQNYGSPIKSQKSIISKLKELE